MRELLCAVDDPKRLGTAGAEIVPVLMGTAMRYCTVQRRAERVVELVEALRKRVRWCGQRDPGELTLAQAEDLIRSLHTPDNVRSNCVEALMDTFERLRGEVFVQTNSLDGDDRSNYDKDAARVMLAYASQLHRFSADTAR